MAGIGLNVNQTLFRSGAPNPVSLAGVTGSAHDLTAVKEKLISLLDSRYAMLMRGETAALAGDYHTVLYRAGEWHHYTDSNGDFEGMIEHVRPDGMLTVRHKEGKQVLYAFREIDYIL